MGDNKGFLGMQSHLIAMTQNLVRINFPAVNIWHSLSLRLLTII